MVISVVDREAATAPPAPAAFERETVLADYRLAWESRQASLLGRREVLTGKAKFGIFGDGKEVAQLALAKAFHPGDFRSGYYRDQTWMAALGQLTFEQLFAQLYANADPVQEPCTAGRGMTGHFATRLIDEAGRFLPLAKLANSSADVSPTGSQMPRLVGLAYASRLFRELPELATLAAASQLSDHGNEVAWGTIGNASCAEGMFWEAVNAVGVLQAPMVLSIWDDGYGISVPNELQVTGDLSQLLSGFRRAPGERRGYDLYRVRGWDYAALCHTYSLAGETARREHVPAIVHVVEMTQPQGHSTSGSHERYKSKERLAWEADVDCLRRMRRWMLDEGLANATELDDIEAAATRHIREVQQRAWDAVRLPIEAEKADILALIGAAAAEAPSAERRAEVERLAAELARQPGALRRDLVAAAQSTLVAVAAPRPAASAGAGGGGRGDAAAHEPGGAARRLAAWRRDKQAENRERYGSDLYSATPLAALAVPVVPAAYAPDAPLVDGHKVMNACFDAALGRYPEVVAIGEDVGQIGDVNQGFAGLQAKYGVLRVSDTGIREATIMGQAIGMALRGLRPIAEIQYLDYVLYGLQILSDDLACLRYRTRGIQKAPVIVRTRGHRLEGIWHAGSPLGSMIDLLQGMYLCVPRNMTQAAGFYNTLLRGDDPAVVVEVLNGYRTKEALPANIGEMTVPLGVAEVLRAGADVTVVTYGACCRIALDAAERLAEVGIEIEIIDVQTLLPFDLSGRIVESLRRTNRVVFMDEDMPGGATAFMMQQVLEHQGGYDWLDSPPRTLPAAPHRPAYGSDGDYWSKPNREDLFEAVYELMHEAAPARFPLFYR